MSMLKNEEYATCLWEYDDGHDYHYVYTDDDTEPTRAELAHRYGSIAKGWTLLCYQLLNEEEY